MNVVACCLALTAALLSIFQPLSVPIIRIPIPGSSLFDFLQIALKIGTDPTMRYFFNSGDWRSVWVFLAVGFALAGLGMWGGYRALKGRGGVIPLALNALVFLGLFGLFNAAVRSRGARVWLLGEFALWGVLYVVAAVCARQAKKEAADAPLAPSIPPTPSPDPTQESLLSIEPERTPEPIEDIGAAEPVERTENFQTVPFQSHVGGQTEISETINVTESLGDDEDVLAPVDEPKDKLVSHDKNRKVGWALVAVLCLAALGGGGYLLLQRHDQRILEEARRELRADLEAAKKAGVAGPESPQVKIPAEEAEEEGKASAALPSAPEPKPEPVEKRFDTPVPMSILGTKVNLRGGPAVDFEVSVLLDEGTPIEVLRRREQPDGEWLFVRLESGREGWIFGDYAQERLGPVGKHGRDLMAIQGTDVNLRSGPSKDTDSLMKLNDGNLVEMMYFRVQEDGRWYYVYTLNGQPGWIFGKYLRERQNF